MKINIEKIREYHEQLSRSAGYQIDEFNTRVEKSGLAYAFEWGGDAMKGAAKQAVASQLEAWVAILASNLEGGSDEWHTSPTHESVKSIINEARSIVMRGARWPERSTSPVSNLMAQEKLAVWAEFVTWYDERN